MVLSADLGFRLVTSGLPQLPAPPLLLPTAEPYEPVARTRPPPLGPGPPASRFRRWLTEVDNTPAWLSLLSGAVGASVGSVAGVVAANLIASCLYGAYRLIRPSLIPSEEASGIGFLTNLMLSLSLGLFFAKGYATLGSILTMPFRVPFVGARAVPTYLKEMTEAFSKTIQIDLGQLMRNIGALPTQVVPWFWNLQRPIVSNLRALGLGGLLFQLGDQVWDRDELRENSSYQWVRAASGVMMVLLAIELSVSSMSLLRRGMYVSALSELLIELGNQRKTTDWADLNYFRFTLGVLRTGIFSMALDRGLYMTRLRRLAHLDHEGFQFRYRRSRVEATLAELRQRSTLKPGHRRYLPPRYAERFQQLFDLVEDCYRFPLLSGRTAPIRLAGLEAALGRSLAERIRNLKDFGRAETLAERFSVALEASIPTNLLMVLPYTVEGWLQGVRAENYFAARAQQVLWPSPAMQFVTEIFGDYTRLRSIILNKFVLFWTFGQATYNLYPKYAGEDRLPYTIVRRIQEADKIDPTRGEAWRRKTSRYLRKKLGRVEGDLISRQGLKGYARAIGYTLTSDAQPLGFFLGRLPASRQFFDRLGDTLFVPDEDAIFTLFDTIRSPDQHSLQEFGNPFVEAHKLADALASYAKVSPLWSPEAALLWPTDPNRYWEEWALLRVLALLAVLSKDLGYSTFGPLQQSPHLARLTAETRSYLRGTSGMIPRDRIRIAVRRIGHEALKRRYGPIPAPEGSY